MRSLFLKALFEHRSLVQDRSPLGRVKTSGFGIWIPLSLMGVVACGQDPAFSEKTSYLEPEVGVEKGGVEVLGQGAEANAGRERLEVRAEVNEDGEPLSTAPGVETDPQGLPTLSDTGAPSVGSPSEGEQGSKAPSAETAVVILPPGEKPGAGETPVAKAGSQVVHNTTQAQGKVDIMWVIDNSGSMSWAQKQLVDRFESFASALARSRVDFRVAVTSTDVCDIDWSNGDAKPNKYCPIKGGISGGKDSNGVVYGPEQGRFVQDYQSGLSVLKSSSSFVADFTRLARIGISGSGFEHGLTAAKMALEKSKSGINKGFLRSDAFLSVIVLSDEEDDGVQMSCEDGYGNSSFLSPGVKDTSKCKKGGSSPYLDAFGQAPLAMTLNPDTNKNYTDYRFTPEMFKDFAFSSNGKGAGKVQVNAITGLRDTQGKIQCNNPEVAKDKGPKEAGTAYVRAAELTGGVVENICSQEWDKLLSNIGKNVGELANQIALPAGKVPFPGTLEVAVDGKKLSAADYVHKEDGNYLVFKKIPASGASIRVQYKETVY